MKITIYSTESCGMCVAAKNLIKKEGLDFEEVNLSKDKEAMAMMREKGVMAVPFIVINDVEIAGYKPGEIMKAINQK